MNISSSTNISDIIINVTTTEETGYTITQIVFIGTIAAILSMLTVVGNVMVMISFKIDKQLQTISNYFLFSLAAADFAVGLISMPLFTVSTLLGYWPLGPFICDTWLALDYLASNASVLNLLIISFDRYFSVTRPLTYRAKRTNKKAAIMIGSAWGISLLLWPPWIYSWPYIEGQRTVPDNQCYIQFIETNHYITFGTAIAAFYVPVSVMVVLYWKIWLTTLRRNEELSNLQAGTQENSKRSNSSVFVCSDEATNACSTVEIEELRRKRSESSTAAAAATENDSTYNMTMMHSSNFNVGPNRRKKLRIHHKKGFLGSMHRLRAWCLDWWHSGREDSSDTEDDSPSEQGYLGGYITPISLDTPLPSSVSRCTSLNVLRDSYVGNRDNWSSPSTTGTTAQISNQMNVTPTRFTSRESRSLPPPPSLPNNNNRRSDGSTDSVYTILIRLPGGDSKDSQNEQPTIQMIPETYYPPPVNTMMNHKLNAPAAASVSSNSTTAAYSNHINRRPSAMPDVRIALNAKGIANKNVVMDAKSATSSLGNIVTKNHHHVVKKKEKKQEKKNDMKAAKTLTAILFTFIFTWLPYNVAVLLKPFAKFDMPLKLWDFFYYLCYINSTINPICYALCNASFRRTYLRILRCKWHSRNRAAVSRGFYNN